MPRRIIKAVVGRLKPWKPTRSLPSYSEPTPETNRKLTRDDEAELALTRTVFTPGTAPMLVALFLVTLVSVSIVQLVAELRAPRAGGGLAMLDVFRALPSAAKVKAVRSLRDVWDLLPHAEELKKAEESLESDSVVSQWLLP